MAQEQIKQRIDKLKKVINHHRYLYHVLDKQEISESALDSLKKELFDLEQKYPKFITKDSPTQRVEGKVLDGFTKVEHKQQMWSFNDAFSKQDMLDWEQRNKKLLTGKEITQLDYFVTPKIDGLAVSLIYDNKGILSRGATRGDGKVGEDVTNNLKTIESIPLKLQGNIKNIQEIRGEVFMTKKSFRDLNKAREKNNEQLYANPRNLAAGTIRQLDPKIVSKRKLSFLAYQLLHQQTQQKEEQKLKEFGFKTVDGKYCKNLEQVFNYYKEILNKRDSFSYHIDGVVVRVNKYSLFDKLGRVGKAPRAAIAFKFPMQDAVTIVEDIKMQVGRTGSVTPVAILKPVEIAGAVISRATLHNQDEIKRLGLKIGDSVIVGRAGDVIPKVFKVLKNLRTGREKDFKMPKNCPVCGGLLIKKPQEVVLRCADASCILRRKRQLYHFVSKGAFNIDGLGPKVIDQLLKENIISIASDIFEIKQGDVVSLERFGEKSSFNLIESIEKAKNISLNRFIFSLGIRGVGEETAVDLANYFCDIKELSLATAEELLEIKDIGPETADNIYSFFKEKRNIELLNKLLKYVKVQNPELRTKNQELKGKTFVLTGTIQKLTRGEAKESIRALGGDVSSSVSHNTDFVVAGKNPGSKLIKAKNFDVKIIKEKEFLKMIK